MFYSTAKKNPLDLHFIRKIFCEENINIFLTLFILRRLQKYRGWIGDTGDLKICSEASKFFGSVCNIRPHAQNYNSMKTIDISTLGKPLHIVMSGSIQKSKNGTTGISTFLGNLYLQSRMTWQDSFRGKYVYWFQSLIKWLQTVESPCNTIAYFCQLPGSQTTIWG